MLLASAAAWAQGGEMELSLINGGETTVLMKAPSQTFVPAVAPSPELVTIYSNLGKGNSVYNAIAGYGILGTDAGQPWPQWVGCDSGRRPTTL